MLPQGPGHKSSLPKFPSTKELEDLVVCAAVTLLQFYFLSVWAWKSTSTAGTAIEIWCYQAEIFIYICFSWHGLESKARHDFQQISWKLPFKLILHGKHQHNFKKAEKQWIRSFASQYAKWAPLKKWIAIFSLTFFQSISKISPYCYDCPSFDRLQRVNLSFPLSIKSSTGRRNSCQREEPC